MPTYTPAPIPAYTPMPAYNQSPMPAYNQSPMPAYNQPSMADYNQPPMADYNQAPVYDPIKPHIPEAYNTFEREATPRFQQPTFDNHSPRRGIVSETKPPLYRRSMSHSRKEDFRRVEDMYSRKPQMSRHNIANSFNPEPRAASPLRRNRGES